MDLPEKKQSTKDPQTKLFDHIVKKSLVNTKKGTNNYSFSTLPGISKIRSQIEQLLLQPLLTQDKHASKKILLRGPCGVGKTFLLKCISNDYNIALIRTNALHPLEGIQKTKLHGKCIIHITNIDTLEEQKDIAHLADIISSTDDVFIVGEVSNPVDQRLRKYNCFEDEILFEVPSEPDRIEILNKLYEVHTKVLECKQQKGINFTEISKLIPGFVASDICKLTRRAILLSKREDLPLNDSHYLHTINSSNTKPFLLSFDDIGGLVEAKRELYNLIILPSLQREKYKKWNIKMSGGILLHGPPGCGKTLLAKAIANLGHFNFVSIKGPEVINKYVGNTEKAIREIFENAKLQQPCIIFLDEIDSLCQKRGNADFNDRVVNQLLTVMDGFDDRGEVFIIAATNRPELIDSAFLRPGRFDKILKIELPNYTEREDIFKKLTKNIEFEYFDFNLIKTDNFSGADIQGFIKDACINFLREYEHYENGLIPKRYFINAANELNKVKTNKKF